MRVKKAGEFDIVEEESVGWSTEGLLEKKAIHSQWSVNSHTIQVVC